MENVELSQVFEEVADLLEIQGANPFRVRAYRSAARTIRDSSEPLAGKAEEQLVSLGGIGKDLAGKIQTIVATGDLPLLQELRGEVPAGLRAMLNIPNVGPKRALTLYKRLKIQSLDELRQACNDCRLRSLDGFGAKMEEKILKALDNVEESGRRVLLAEAKVFADAVVKHLEHTPGLNQIDVAGSYRRRRETVGDLDLLVSCRRAGPVMDRLAEYEAVAEILARGRTKMTVRLRNGLQMDLRVVPEESYGAALQYFTGAKSHSILVRRRAQQQGLKLNEYGVFRGARRIAGRTEEDVYKAVGLPWIPPELRQARGEIERALDGRLPNLIGLGDLRGDLHMHTTATDGRATIAEMIGAARKRGHRYMPSPTTPGA
jgi:DNA polymerase (family 10)